MGGYQGCLSIGQRRYLGEETRTAYHHRNWEVTKVVILLTKNSTSCSMSTY